MVVASYREIFSVSSSFSLTGGTCVWSRREGLCRRKRPGDKQMLSLDPQEDLTRPVNSSFGASVLPVLFSGHWWMSTTCGSHLSLKARSP